MPIHYKPTVFRSEVNITYKKSLWSILRLFLGVLALILSIYVSLGFFVEQVAYQITPAQELWLWEHMRAGYQIQKPPQKKKYQKMEERLQGIFASIPKDKLPIQYNYRVMLDYKPYVNAFAVPGGKIVVTTKLMEMLPEDRALTFVLGHELGHFQGRHHLVSLERMLVMTMFSKALFGRDFSKIFAKLIGLFDLQYSRRQELSADRWGMKLLKATYGDYKGAKTFFKKMHKMRGSSVLEEFLSTHPSPQHRIQRIDKIKHIKAEKKKRKKAKNNSK